MPKQTAFTELQKDRIRFHLKLPSNLNPEFLELLNEYSLDTGLRVDTIFQVVGEELEVPPQSDRILLLGDDLCQEGSILANIEAAYTNLQPGTISDSLFVSQAGSVTLRKDELRARRQLYNSLLDDLYNLLDIPPDRRFGGSSHIGYQKLDCTYYS